eukprot:g1474.t1
MKRRVTPSAEEGSETAGTSESSFDSTATSNTTADGEDADEVGDIHARTSVFGTFVDASLEEMYVRQRWDNVHRDVGNIMILMGILWGIIFGTGLSDVNEHRMPLIYTIKMAGFMFYCAIGWAFRKRRIYRLTSVRRVSDVAFVTFILGQSFQQIFGIQKSIRDMQSFDDATDQPEHVVGVMQLLATREHLYSIQVAAKYAVLQSITFVHIMSACLSGQQVIVHGILSWVTVVALSAVSRSMMSNLGYTFDGMGAVYLRIIIPTTFALYIIAQRDISLQRRMRQKYTENMRRVARASEEARLVANQRAHTRFVATFSHELRTPLTSILGNLELLGVELAGRDSDTSRLTTGSGKVSKFVNRAMSSSRLLLSLVNNIIDLSRLETGALVLQHQDFGVLDMLHTVEDVVKTAAEVKQLRVGFVVDKTVPAVLRGDSTRFQQVLLNFTANACKFTPIRGRIDIHITVSSVSGDEKKALHDAEIAALIAQELGSDGGANDGDDHGGNIGASGGSEHKLLEDEVKLCVSVRDSGIGIPLSEQKRIWDMFYKLDNQKGARGKGVDVSSGTGCGLTICKQLVGLMGGEVSVKSMPGIGSAFTFTAIFQLPGSPRPAANPTGSSSRRIAPVCSSVPGTQSRARVLLAEDNAFNVEVLCEMLKGICDVTSVADGEEAVEVYTAAATAKDQSKRFDLVLMDCNMPRKDGFAATRAIRELEDANGIGQTPIIALTAHGDGDKNIRSQCKSAGMDSFISKPVYRGELLTSVQAVLCGGSKR